MQDVESHTDIRTEDGRTVITKTDGEGHTKTVVIEGGMPFAARGGDSVQPWFAGLGILLPVLILLVIFGSKLLQTRMAVRHGYPIKVRGQWVQPGGGTDAKRAAELMAVENDKLRGQVGRLEERVAVLERIVTDPARRVADEIEALRR